MKTFKSWSALPAYIRTLLFKIRRRYRMIAGNGPVVCLDRAMADIDRIDEGSGIVHIRNLVIVGWAIAGDALEGVELVACGAVLGQGYVGLPREDVAALYPGLPGARMPGFELAIREFPLAANLAHALELQFRGRTGIRARYPVLMVEQKLRRSRKAMPVETAAVEYIDFNFDSANLTADGQLLIEGWAVAGSGVREIVASLDDIEVGRTEPTIWRSDVAQSHETIPSAMISGFSLKAQLEGNFGGEYAFKLTVVSEDGTSKTYSLSLAAQAPAHVPLSENTTTLHIDMPRVVDGVMSERVHERLEVSGWCIDGSGIDRIELAIDNVIFDRASFGIRRPDVHEHFPDVPESLLSGFSLNLAASKLADGEHHVELVVTARNGAQTRRTFNITVEKRFDDIPEHRLREKMPLRELRTRVRILERAGYAPDFHFVMPITELNEQKTKVADTVASLARQLWGNWRLALVFQGSNGMATDWMEWLEGAGLRSNVQLIQPNKALMGALVGVAAAQKSAVLAGVLYPGDLLGVDALLELALAQNGETAAMTYSDDRRYAQQWNAIRPFFKPDWSPDLAMSTNYIGQAFVVNAALLSRIPTRDHDIDDLYGTVLALTARADAIQHVRKVLCELDPQPVNVAVDLTAIRRALKSSGIEAEIEAGFAPGHYRVRRKIVKPGMVSIIIPSIAANAHVRTCIESIRRLSTYKNYEIIILDNLHGEKLTAENQTWKTWFVRNADVVVPVPEAFNWSRFNNIGARASKGEYLLFLNDDIEIIDPRWLERLVENAQRPEVGLVGARLLYPDGRVQHGGMFLTYNNIARHAFRFEAKTESGYFGLALSQRNVTAVTGACMMTRREIYDAVGGFDEHHSVVNNDLDFCLRIRAQGRLVVLISETEIIHHELASRANMADVFDTVSFEARWGEAFALGDPYYSPGLSLNHDDFRYETEPLREIVTGYPLAARSSIRNILIVKLDHIGDVATAIPAVSRARELFPAATIRMLVAPSSAQLAQLIPGVAEVFEFQFFNPKSGLGLWELTERDYAGLKDRLAAYAFDLAIDMRKLGETRDILRYACATYTAGFDSQSRHPWLDIPVANDIDVSHGVKRHHVSEDFRLMMDAVAAAFDDGAAGRGALLETVSDQIRPELLAQFPELFARPYVVVHPAAGNVLRQWPPANFALLVDLLVVKENIAVAILGSPDERDIVEKVMAAISNKQRVYSLLGHTRLADVPSIIRRAALFVGNNSGPSHIAGGLDVPTVAVHSSVVASEEWAPLGRDAVAVRKSTSCGPCYLPAPENCSHGIACLRRLPVGAVFKACQRMLRLTDH